MIKFASNFTQSGTANPALQDTTTNALGSASMTRTTAGDYNLTITGAFAVPTNVIVSLGGQGSPVISIQAEVVDANTINIQTFDGSFFNADLDSLASIIILQ